MSARSIQQIFSMSWSSGISMPDAGTFGHPTQTLNSKVQSLKTRVQKPLLAAKKGFNISFQPKSPLLLYKLCRPFSCWPCYWAPLQTRHSVNFFPVLVHD